MSNLLQQYLRNFFRCDQPIDQCLDNPCVNGGSCVTQEAGSFSCHCPAGYKGSRCQLLVDHCAISPCKNNATCTNLGVAYHCACPLGFDGVHCEHNIDECSQGRCNLQGTQRCVDGVNSFECLCNPGYSGQLCEQKIDQVRIYCNLLKIWTQYKKFQWVCR